MEHEIIQLIVHSMDATELFLESITKAKNNNWNEVKQLINEGNQRLKKAQKVREIFLKNENCEEIEQSLKIAIALQSVKNAEVVKENCIAFNSYFKKMSRLENIPI
ncbi:PTS lactose/cellobiose transporter subunit IIA [Pseudogracilibacillus auburnensis]|uniref:PTS lactose/cellobiose transporter subunit IIA n=1 Tax=Pseudogracilibacillus auburnensis TaxID=1494959 RepID=UPI001A96F300|nr:PTS lactose/cellobiose transporter subunit IIA [Pseudogracilibacillus auburnensis]MBO1002631.1 PTS lactose/cellobiose transporter subunit IIA [Pseudogracilibacillus auburnensis]